jgi:hypothetical protein
MVRNALGSTGCDSYRSSRAIATGWISCANDGPDYRNGCADVLTRLEVGSVPLSGLFRKYE